VLLAAAVSDYGPETGPLDDCRIPRGKISSSQDELTIRLKPLPKIIAQVKQWNPDVFLVGFKLLVDASEEDLAAAAKKQIDSAGSDLVVANDMRDLKMGAHRLHLFTKDGLLKTLDGPHIAELLIQQIQCLAVEKVQ